MKRKREYHGEGSYKKGRSRTYKSWMSMMRRCYTPSSTGYYNYGARGIKVCLRWHSFIKFKEDMGACPTDWSIERIDANKGYNRNNCVWASKFNQNRNTRRTLRITHKGVTMCAADWAIKLNIPKVTFWRKIKKGLSVEEII